MAAPEQLTNRAFRTTYACGHTARFTMLNGHTYQHTAVARDITAWKGKLVCPDCQVPDPKKAQQ